MSVAVVIPLFNHERYIGDALRSVLAQSRPPDRVIVIDDGSTDRSLDAARAVVDSRVTLLSQPNSGAHATLNRAVGLAADCDYLGILNSDDLYEPARIESCLRSLEGRPSAAVVVTRLQIIDENGEFPGPADARVRWLSSVWHARPASLAAWLGIANFTKTTSNLFGRAGYFRAHPFRPYRYVHDYFFALGAALEDRLLVLDEELLRYRVHGSNTIKSGPAGKLPREVLRMNVDLMRAFAPALAESPGIRARFADYFRTLSANYADFRLEPFLHLAAHQFAPLSDSDAELLCEQIDPERFPELLAGKSNALRETMARAESDARLAALRKACDRSAWFRIGKKLGFIHIDPPDHE